MNSFQSPLKSFQVEFTFVEVGVCDQVGRAGVLLNKSPLPAKGTGHIPSHRHHTPVSLLFLSFQLTHHYENMPITILYHLCYCFCHFKTRHLLFDLKVNTLTISFFKLILFLFCNLKQKLHRLLTVVDYDLVGLSLSGDTFSGPENLLEPC